MTTVGGCCDGHVIYLYLHFETLRFQVLFSECEQAILSTKQFPVTPFKFSVYCHFPFVRTPSLTPSPLPPLPQSTPTHWWRVGVYHSVDVETLQLDIITEGGVTPSSEQVGGVTSFDK